MSVLLGLRPNKRTWCLLRFDFRINRRMDKQMIADIAKRKGGIASGVFLLALSLFVIKLIATEFDGTPQSAMLTAVLAFVVGITLANALRWDILVRKLRRPSNPLS